MAAVHEIIANPETMTITVGSKVFDRPVLGRFPEMFMHLKQEICGPSDLDWGPLKDQYQRFTHLLGPKFNRRFQAANYWLWVGNRMSERVGNMLKVEGRHWKQYNNDLVWEANQILPHVRRAEQDGLLHLIPAIIAFQESPQQIKRRIGQGAWRKVAANSVTRNLKIMNAARRRRTGMDHDAAFVRLLDVPSGVLRGIMTCDEAEFIAARLTHRRRIPEYMETLHLVGDTMQMVGRRHFNPGWSYNRMVEEHNAAVKEQHSRHYSAKRFTDDWSFEKDGFTATLLTSRLDIAMEGSTQHHCVGAYASLAAAGEYAVFRIEGTERATVGLSWSAPDVWRVDQVYAACNRAVSPACVAFVRSVAREYSSIEQERAA